MSTDLLAPQTFAELDRWAQRAAATELVPRDYRGKPDAIIVAVEYGREIGLSIMQALTSVAVINGRPTIYGDAALALCIASPVCEEVREEAEIGPTGEIVAYHCIAKRRGHLPKVHRFSVEDAKRAKLWGKAGPWTEYPQRMLQFRARGFALRDAFPDVLKGVITREEAEDYGPVIESEIPSQTLSRPQLEELSALLHDTNTDSNSFLNMMLTGVTDMEAIPARDFVRLKNALVQKKQRMEKPA